jgi:peptidoglycan/LPS O-acetylase OafA/YrhL
VQLARPWGFRSDVEGLRAIAIVGVILFHAGVSTVSGGFLGVDVFFVLSGFLITGVIVAEVQARGRLSLAAFWARRIRRLLPAATLVSIVTIMLAATLDSPQGEQAYAKSAMAFATYWSNLLFVRHASAYFDQTTATDPFLHTWSLAVEEQYYLVVAPLCLALVIATWKLGSERFLRTLFTILVIISVASLAGGLLLSAREPIKAFYELPTRAWEFGVGGMLACLFYSADAPARWAGGFAIAGLLAMLASFFVADASMPHPGVITLLPVLGTAALIHAGGAAAPRPAVVRVLDSRILGVLGRLSYSWYLWHWPLTIYWGQIGGDIPLLIGMPIASLVLAQITYVTLEAPARRAAWLQSPRRGLVVGGVVAALTLMVAYASLRHGGRRMANPEFAFITNALRQTTRSATDHCLVAAPVIEPKVCDYGNRASDTTVVMFGDSHTAQWFSAIDTVVTRRGWHEVTLFKSGCPVFAITVMLGAQRRSFYECDRWRERALQRIEALRPRLIVLGSADGYLIAPSAGGKPTAMSPAAWRIALQKTLGRLPATSAIVLLLDTPNAHFLVPPCLYRHAHDVERCSFARDSAIEQQMVIVERAVARRDPRVAVADFTDSICGQARCRAVIAGQPVFIDKHHLSVPYVKRFAPWFAATFDSMLTTPRRVATQY